MKMDTDYHPAEWKSGTDALSLCMICGGEYPPETQECPNCKVSLSLVRRCPSCRRIVSAQHTKCVHCRTPFTEELPARRPAEELQTLGTEGPSPAVRRFRAAAVSIATFLIVFCLGMFFLHQVQKPSFTVTVIAKAHVIHSAELRRTPSSSSSDISKVLSGTSLQITSFQENDEGRWIAVNWNGTTSYLPASDISVPEAVEASEGANALKFYLAGMDSESANEAVNAVDEYAHAFPGDARIDELRWALAERLRALSQRGGAQGTTLRSQARQQYQQLADGNGKFAGKAREALKRTPSPAEPAPRTRIAPQKKDDIQIIGGSGTLTSITPSPSHDVLILNQAELRVRVGKLAELTAGAVVGGRVAKQVQTNGVVAIPAGAPCQLTVISAEPPKLSLALTSIEIDRRAYAVKSAPVDLRSDKGAASILFRLDAPVVIER